MTPKEHARWWIAYARLKGDRFLTERFAAARIVIAILATVVLWPLTTLQQPTPGVSHAIADWIVYIIILIVAAILAVALAPKPVQPEIQKGQRPVAEDGKSIQRIYGEVWIEDAMVLGFETMGADPIKKKGGKK